MKRKPINLFLTVLVMMLLILDSRHVFTDAAEGVDICTRTVIPSLFPFFVLSIYLTGTISGSSAVKSILISGFLGGYPVGAQSAAEAYRSGKVSSATANRLIMFCSQTGPSFLFGITASMFPEQKYIWYLWVIILLSSWTVSKLIPCTQTSNIASGDKPPLPLPATIKKATQAIASVCGWVVLFRIILGFIQRCGLWLLPDWTQVLISGLLELTNGSLMLGRISTVSIRFILAAIMLNFGGICVLMQTASVSAGLSVKKYLLGKLMQTVFATLYALCFLGHIPAIIPILLVYLVFRRENRRKRSRFPVLLGVLSLQNRKER